VGTQVGDRRVTEGMPCDARPIVPIAFLIAETRKVSVFSEIPQVPTAQRKDEVLSRRWLSKLQGLSQAFFIEQLDELRILDGKMTSLKRLAVDLGTNREHTI
jgi:hypothetical protein